MIWLIIFAIMHIYKNVTVLRHGTDDDASSYVLRNEKNIIRDVR